MKTWIDRISHYAITAIILLMVACAPSPATLVPTNTPIIATQPADPLVATPSAQTPVVLDTDMSIDAIMAILYILQRPELSIKSITVAGDGEVHCSSGVSHALGLIAMANAGKIPVACGRETPLEGDHQFPSQFRNVADSSLRIIWPKTEPGSNITAVELLQKTINSASQPVVVVTDGPLTNVAEAILADPQLINNIQMIYIMGGAISVPGNLYGVPDASINSTAEANFYIDPHAASVVINSGAPITLVPLDATNQAPLDTVFFNALSEHKTTAAANAVYNMLDYTGSYQQMGTFLWDPLTYAIASDESLATFETKRITVIEEEGSEIGRTKVSQTGTDVRVAISPDVDRFLDTYLSTLNGGEQIAFDWVTARFTPTPLPNSVKVITESGKCWFETSNQVLPGPFAVILYDKDPGSYAGLAFVTLDADKTLADLEAWPSVSPPSWLEVVDYIEALPGMEVSRAVEMIDKPIYLVCFDISGKMGALGPIVSSE